MGTLSFPCGGVEDTRQVKRKLSKNAGKERFNPSPSRWCGTRWFVGTCLPVGTLLLSHEWKMLILIFFNVSIKTITSNYSYGVITDNCIRRDIDWKILIEKRYGSHHLGTCRGVICLTMRLSLSRYLVPVLFCNSLFLFTCISSLSLSLSLHPSPLHVLISYYSSLPMWSPPVKFTSYEFG